MRDEELEIRNEELGINAVGPLGRVLFCGAVPRAVPMADGVLQFQRADGCAAGRLGIVWFGVLTH